MGETTSLTLVDAVRAALARAMADDPTVLVLERPSTRMACVRFGGRATDARIAREVERLHRALAGSPWRAIGPPVVMGYDPPWQLLGRRNEVGVAVERTDGQG